MTTKLRRILRLKEVQDRYPKSRAQIWRDVRAGLFPAPVEFGLNSMGWFEDEVDAHIEALPRRTYHAEGAEPEAETTPDGHLPEAADSGSNV